jgi:hypothetical protein
VIYAKQPLTLSLSKGGSYPALPSKKVRCFDKLSTSGFEEAAE